MKNEKKVFFILLIIFFIFMCLSSIFAFQVTRYDTHIKDELVRQRGLILDGTMAFSSFFSALFLILKKEKWALFFIIVFIGIILQNTIATNVL